MCVGVKFHCGIATIAVGSKPFDADISYSNFLFQYLQQFGRKYGKVTGKSELIAKFQPRIVY
jgi:hypothetical protein